MGRFACGRCCLSISALEERITCDGCCETEYHLSCTKLNVYDLRRCTENDNLLWLCDQCLWSFRKRSNASNNQDSESSKENDTDKQVESSLESTIHLLQSDVAEMKQSLSEFKSLITTSQIASPRSIHPRSSSTPLETDNAVERNHTVKNNRTNTSQLLVGSNNRTTSMNATGKFWIYFTKVAKHVSVDAMKTMVSNSLNLVDPPDVTKIVPLWSNHEDLRYISFKVGVDQCYKKKALEESTWPTGLFYREFIQRESLYWEP